ncbi:MAG: hypothetical protein ACK4SF_10660 [Algoriphagus aquaeductus]|uniref:hypothetical protein n=1 Tax=Algoriphagus TaxID=246875 RepID=UPI002584FF81|nr:hypothetical protein [Algoriphagus sp.]
MQVIKKIDVGSAAKVYGLTLGILGIVIGLIYALIFSSISSLVGEEIPMAGAGLGVAMLIFIPILYGIIGVVFGAVGALVYNFVGNKFGGLEVEIVDLNPIPQG